MARSFNLTAELNLRGPSNVRLVVADIRRQLQGVNVDVGVRIDPAAARNIANIQNNLTRFNTTLGQTQTNANSAAAAVQNLSRAVASLSTNLNAVPRNVQNLAGNVNNLTRNLGQANTAVQQTTSQFEEFGRQSALAVRRFAAFATVTGLIYKVSNAIGSATKEFVDFNKELIRVAQVTDEPVQNLGGLVDRITRLSTGLGVTSKELIQVSSTLAQAGLSAQDTAKALEALALSALAPSFDSLNDTVEGSIALMRQFGIGAGDLKDALGSVNAVAAKFAVEAGDLITAIQRTGGVFATASKGVSEGKDALNEFLAVFTSVRATTRESAETIATGLRTIFTRIQRSETIDALTRFGVVLTDLEGKFVGPYEAVRRLSEGLSKLDPRDLRFSDIVEELGGFRQIGKVIPLIQQFATAQAALKVAQEGQGSLAKDAATAQQSVANQLVKVREEFNALVRSIGQSESFQTFIKLSLDLASGLIKLADSAKTVLPALTAIAAIRGVSALGQFGVGFTRGLRRQNAGGPVRGFASGGYVPGVGNSDTVPAMLTPGEFVIRKKAVESIGLSSLQDMNRYTFGGQVQKFAQRGTPGSAGQVRRLPQAVSTAIKRQYTSKQIAEAKAAGTYDAIVKEEMTKYNRSLGGKKGAETRKGKKIEEAIAQAQTFGLVGLFGGSGSEFIPTNKYKKGIPPQPLNILYSSLDNAQDSTWNSTLAQEYEGIMKGRFRDTISFIGRDIAGRIGSSVVTDESRIQAIMKKSGVEGAIGNMLEGSLGMAGAPYNNDVGKQNASIDFPGGLGSVASLFPNMPGTIPTDATRNVKGKGIARYVAQVSRYLATTNPPQATPLSEMPSVARKAAGGSISSEDTVPALLTPGEFVINKRAASRIGMARLTKLNNADRIGYNSGGPVGSIVQRFEDGGGVFKIAQDLIKEGRSLADAMAIARRTVSDATAKDPSIRTSSASATTERLSRKAAERGVDFVGAGLTAQRGSFAQFDARLPDRVDARLGRGAGASIAASQLAAGSGGQYVMRPGIAAQGASVGGNIQMSQAGQQFAAQISMTKTPLQQLSQGFSNLIRPISTTQGVIATLGQATKMAATSVGGLAKSAAMGAGRGIGGAISSIGGGAIRGIRGVLTGQGMSAGAGLALTMGGGLAIEQLSRSAGGEKTETGRMISSVGGNVLNYGATGAAIGSMIAPILGPLAPFGPAIGAATGALYGLYAGLQEAEKANYEYAQSQREDAASKAGESSGKVLQSYLSGPPTASGRAAVRSALIQTSQKEDVALLGARRQKGQSIQEFAAQQVKTQQAGAEQSRTFLAAEMMRTGKTFAEIKNVMNPADFARFAKDIAQADESFIAFQKGAQEDVEALAKTDPAAAAELQKRVNAAQQVMAERIAARQMAEQDAAVQAANTAKASAKLAIQLEKSVLSLEKTFGAMDQALNRVGFDIGQAAKQREEIVSGRASLTGGGRARDINVLQNPNAYSAAEAQAARRRSASVIGGRSGDLAMRVSTFTDTARNAATRTVSANARAGQRDQTKTAQDVENALLAQIEGTFGADTSIGRDLSASVRSMIQEKIKKAGEGEAINFDELINSALGPIQKASEQANNILISATEKLSQAFDELGNVAQATADIQKRQKDRSIAFAEMRSGSLISQREAMGAKITPEERIRARLENINRRAGIGGAGAPLKIPGTSQAMGGRIQALQGEQQALVKRRDELEKAGASAAPELLRLQTRLANVNNELEDTKKSFESLPQDLEGMIGDLTSAISERAAELESRKEAGANFAERLVGSTPQELAELNRTYQLLNNTLNGNITTINRSQSAQQAYFEALRQGKTQQEAYGDAQQAFANDAKNAMSLFNDIMQMSGVKGAEFDKMRADMLVNFARAQGNGLQNNPMFVKVIQELRKNPEQRAAEDPIIQELIKRAEVIRGEQDAALAKIKQLDEEQRRALEATGAKLIQGINEAKLQVQVAVQNVAAQAGQQVVRPRARGGIIYASNGRLVNFQPKGTDTVPAMLTPGEFVVNAKSTRENLPLLQSINRSKGGPVYMADGGDLSGVSRSTSLNTIANNSQQNKVLQNNIYSGIRNLAIKSESIKDDTSDTLDSELPRLNNNATDGFRNANIKLNSIGKDTKYTAGTIKKVADFSGINPNTMSSGGVVYASSGAYMKPRGKDTVPAMLSPGEFVINAASTKNNLGLLHSINKSKGGRVSYFQDGGVAGDDQPEDFDVTVLRASLETAKKNEEMLRQNGQKYFDARNAADQRENVMRGLQTYSDANFNARHGSYLRTSTDTDYDPYEVFIKQIGGAKNFILDPDSSLTEESLKKMSDAQQSQFIKFLSVLMAKKDVGRDARDLIKSKNYGKFLEKYEDQIYGSFWEDTVEGDYKKQYMRGNDYYQALLSDIYTNAYNSMIPEGDRGGLYLWKDQLNDLTKLTELKGIIENQKPKIPQQYIRDLDTHIRLVQEGTIGQLDEKTNNWDGWPEINNVEPGPKNIVTRQQAFNYLKVLIARHQAAKDNVKQIQNELDAKLGRAPQQPQQPQQPQDPQQPQQPQAPKDKKQAGKPQEFPDTGKYRGRPGEGPRRYNQAQLQGIMVRNQQLRRPVRIGPDGKPIKQEGEVGDLSKRMEGGYSRQQRIVIQELIDQTKAAATTSTIGNEMLDFAKEYTAGEKWSVVNNNGIRTVTLPDYTLPGRFIVKNSDQKSKEIEEDINKTDKLDKQDKLQRIVSQGATRRNNQEEAVWNTSQAYKMLGKNDKAENDQLGRVKSYMSWFEVQNAILRNEINWIDAVFNRLKAANIQGVDIAKINWQSKEGNFAPPDFGDLRVVGADQWGPAAAPAQPQGQQAPGQGAAPRGMRRGGMIYASNGQLVPYQPKGTDTVPAMLTPGEFVVNRQATQQNLPLLQSINSGQYSRGGKVAYLAEGTPGTDAIQQNLKYLSDILMKGAENLNIALTEAVNKINGVQNPQNTTKTNGVSNSSFNIDALGNRLDQFIQQLQNALPPVIKVEGRHDVNVIINGGAALQNALQGPIGQLVQTEIQKAFDLQNRKNELA